MRRSIALALVVVAATVPARAHGPRTETQNYRTSTHLGSWISSETNCRYLRNVTVACFDLDGHDSRARITIDDRATEAPISGLAEFRIGGVWNGYIEAQRFCGDGVHALDIPDGATAMLIRTAIPAMDYTWCLRGIGIPVSGTITAAIS